MAVTIYRSTTGGAPTYNNTAGTFLGVLNYALVTGQSWTSTSLGTNQTKYVAPSGNQKPLQVDDSNAAFAACTGWETLTALNTGTGRFPASGSFFVDHANQAVADAWRLITNGTVFHFFVIWDTSNNPNNANLFTFGDIVSYKSSDAYGTIIAGNTASNTTSLGWNGTIAPTINTANTNVALDRAYNQTTANPSCCIFSDSGRSTDTTNYIGGYNEALGYPDPISGAINLAPYWIGEGANGTRGLVPGVWHILHSRAMTDGSTFTVTSGLLSGRSFEVWAHPDSTRGQIAVETSNTWGGF